MKKFLLTFLVITCMLPMSNVHASIIYTVKESDSLWGISEKYKTSPDKLQEINGIKDPSKLLPGQSLSIPGNEYVIDQQDSLWKIANLHQTSIEQIVKLNNLSSETVHVGQRLKIPQSTKRNIDAGAFFLPSTPAENKWMMDFYSEYLSAIGFFEYRANIDGDLSSLHGEEAIKLAWQKGLTPYATITNLTSQGFDSDLAHSLLADSSKQQTLIENLATLVDQKQYKGVIIDFENLKPKDRALYNTFIEKLNKRMKKIGGEVGVSIPPMQGNRQPAHHSAYDYQTLGTHSDFIFLMTYNWHWSGGEAGSIAPIKQVDETINYAVSVIPSNKIYLGIAMYAYDWNTTSKAKEAEAYSQQKALSIAAKKSGKINYSFEKATPWFRYYDDAGDLHEVWFEDARSLLPSIA
ncbi:LysM peptidoglycan-binding domain-containing protein [Halobacillus seohaensis]|uniref:LysM peptidoglycan-binding domain-containing protein n=1 Tax=Halobacillus seohaensis TaxID=447421 RepID=A0ABW2EJW5_9BACI